MSDLFSELKRRNVFRVAIGYLVMGWLLVQVGDIMFDAFGAPPWVMRVTIGLLALGFPVALFLSWAFELTPEGIKREKDVNRNASVTHQTGSKLDRFIIVALSLAVVFLVVDRYLLSPTTTTPDATQQADAVIENTQPSIAVLPFANMSSDDENEHFCDGLSEELLNVLAKIPNLKVAGRTSSFHFKGQNPDLRDVGLKLGVDHILEGSVRKSGDNVRITAQLIKAEDGFHIWSETWDRKLTDIFAIQDEIAAHVANALRVQLLGADQSVATQHVNIPPAVYAEFIAAKSRLRGGSNEDSVRAHELLKSVVQEAPDYAPGWAALTMAVLDRWRFNRDIRLSDARAEAKDAIDKAMALAPNDDYVLTAYGAYLSDLAEKANYAGMQEVNQVFRKAIALNPENIEARYYLAFNLNWMQEFEAATGVIEEILALDPLNAPARYLMVWALGTSGRAQATRKFTWQSIQLLPEEHNFYFRASGMEMSSGRQDYAVLWLRAMQERYDNLDEGINARLYRIYYTMGYQPGVDELAPWMRENRPQFMKLLTLVEAGRFDALFAWVQEAIERDGWGDWERDYFRAAVLADRCDAVFESRVMSRLYTQWTETETPVVDGTNDLRASGIAHCFQRLGLDSEAQRLLEAIETFVTAKPVERMVESDWSNWLATLALRGRVDDAVAVMQDYYDHGFGDISGPNAMLANDPVFANLHDHPEFQRLHKAIVERNYARMEAINNGEVTLESLL